VKDLGRTRFFLGLQLEHLHTSIPVHQSDYVQKVLEIFNMDKAYPTRTPMLVGTIEKETNTFRQKEEEEEVLGQEYSYLRLIGVQMYLANNTRPDVAFIVNCLTRHNTAPTMCHQNCINNILRYLIGMTNLRLFF
jgi:hypothetical protein